jgi:hypothetical protein
MNGNASQSHPPSHLSGGIHSVPGIAEGPIFRVRGARLWLCCVYQWRLLGPGNHVIRCFARTGLYVSDRQIGLISYEAVLPGRFDLLAVRGQPTGRQHALKPRGFRFFATGQVPIQAGLLVRCVRQGWRPVRNCGQIHPGAAGFDSTPAGWF